MLPDKKNCSSILMGVVSCVKYCPSHWEMTLRNGKGLGRGSAEGIHRRDESRVFHYYLSSPLGMRPESEERPQPRVYYRAGAKTGRENEDLKLTYLFCWLYCFSSRLIWWILREYFLESEDGITG